MADAAHVHKKLGCGIEFAALPLPDRRTVSAQLRFLVGFAHEPQALLGLNHIVEQTISMGTETHSGPELSDAFDTMGIGWSSWAARESTGYQFTCLPEFVEPALELHAEFLRRPTFPDDAVGVAIENHLQEIESIADDPHDLVGKLFNRQVYGPVLGRHVLGEKETLRHITPTDVKAHWQDHYQAGRIQISMAGAVDVARIENKLNELFSGFGNDAPTGREPFTYQFESRSAHHQKELEQEHIGICYPGASLNHPLRYAQAATMGVLSGGMSSRLFTEVREKQGLVYWVTATTEHPRGIGIVYLGASTTPKRCEQTYRTLLREVDRLGEDLEDTELQRAITGIVGKMETRGDITRARCSALADDLFHYGEVIPLEEKIAKIRAVGVADVKGYLEHFPRDRLSVFTLGPVNLTI